MRRLFEGMSYSYIGVVRMNDPEVMERIAEALERIAYFLEFVSERR